MIKLIRLEDNGKATPADIVVVFASRRMSRPSFTIASRRSSCASSSRAIDCNKFIYAQLVDDIKGHTYAEAHAEDAKKVGIELAKKAKDLKIIKVVFDRGGYLYTGKIKAVADALREGGLSF